MKKTLISLLVLSLVLSLCACGKKAVEQSDEPVISDTGKISAMQYCDGSVTLRFARQEDATWYWVDGPDFPLDGAYMEAFAADISQVLKGKSTGTCSDPANYGLDSERKYLSLQTTDGEVNMVFGNQMSGGNWYMYYKENPSALYEVGNNFVEKLSVSIFDMAVIPSLPELSEDNVLSITLTIASGEFLKLENKDGQWDIIGKRISGLNDMAQAAMDAELLKCVDFQPSSGAASLCGLDSALRVTIHYTNTVNTESDLVLCVGTTDSEQVGYFATLGDSSTIYLVNREALEPLVTLAQEQIIPAEPVEETAG